MEILNFTNKSPDEWDDFIASSGNGTIFHTRKFLQYHENKFKDREFFIGFKQSKKLVACISYSIEERNGVRTLLSPYGASYGGFVFADAPSYKTVELVIENFLEHIQSLKIQEVYLAFPIEACSKFCQDTIFSVLLGNGFVSSVRDLTSVYVKHNEGKFSKRARRSFLKAQKLGVEYHEDAPFEDFWKVVNATYKKHGVPPTHSAKEYQKLNSFFGNKISWKVCYLNGTPISALGTFRITNSVDSAFYLCQDPKYQDSQSLSYLIISYIKALPKNVSYFSFGTVTTYEMKPRYNVIEFKENFSKIGMFRETFLWKKN